MTLTYRLWLVGYRLNRLDELVLIAVSKPLLTEFGIHLILKSCVRYNLAVAEVRITIKKMTVPIFCVINSL